MCFTICNNVIWALLYYVILSVTSIERIHLIYIVYTLNIAKKSFIVRNLEHYITLHYIL